jgi:hypothetical protein
MIHSEYELKLYHPDLMAQVVSLLSHLWGNNHDQNLSYFQWKYHENPFTKNPLGIVTHYKGKVVGFRGYLATKWQVREKNYTFNVLCPGDTVVDPDHRRKRLSVIMGDRAMDEYESEYKVFFNFSSTKNSVPGYLRMGFIPLFNKAYINRDTILGLMKFILTVNKREGLHQGKITFGDFGNIIVSDRPNPKEMSAVVHKQKSNGRKISLFQDEKFFTWRFSNNRRKYAFYYYQQNNNVNGYVVINVSENNKRGFISDYSADDYVAIEEILNFILKNKHFEIVSIYSYSINNDLSKILRKLRFKNKSLTRTIEKRKEGEWPLFIRPVKPDYGETDCFIEGLDIRKIESWEIKEICSDGG